MALSFELSDVDADFFGFTTTNRDNLWAATQAMVHRMRDELWGYFGIAVNDAGAWPTLTLTPASGGNTIALRDATAQIHSNSAAWHVARGRLESFIRRGNTLFGKLRSSLPHGYPVIGMETQQSDLWNALGSVSRTIVFNPFTYFRADGVTSAVQFSSERARATHSATLHLLHELNHYWGRMFAGRSVNVETDAVNDVDTAISCHSGIGTRRSYFWDPDGPGPRESVYRALPGMRTFVDLDVEDTYPSAPVPAGREWVILPNVEGLRTGR